MCRDHHEHSELFQDINQIHDVKYHPCPRWFVLSSTILLPFVQQKLVRVWCYTLISLLSSLWYVLPWSITICYVKNVVRIPPPLNNSWYKQYFTPSPFFLDPHVDSNRGTNKWMVLLGFYTSSNPISLKLMTVGYWITILTLIMLPKPIFWVHLSTSV